MLWCPILQNSFLERGSDPAAAGCPACHQDLRPGQEGEGGGDCISHDIGTGARSIDVVLTGARTNVLLAPVLVIAVTTVINLPASGGRKEFVYDQPSLHSYLIL